MVNDTEQSDSYTLKEVKQMLISDEGWVNKPYQDHLGYWTVGVGHNLQANSMPNKTVEQLLESDIAKTEAVAFQVFGTQFGEFEKGRQLAILNMIFQMGGAGFRKFKRTIKAMKDNKWEDAAEYGMQSLWAKQTPARAKRVTQMLRTGENIYEA